METPATTVRPHLPRRIVFDGWWLDTPGAHRMDDWRASTFRDRRLMRYVDQHPATIAPEGPGGIFEH